MLCQVSDLDNADEPGSYLGLKERQKSKSILLRILRQRKKKIPFFLTYIFLSYLVLLSCFFKAELKSHIRIICFRAGSNYIL